MAGTGTRDEVYDVLSVLYHALEGAEACERYLQDAAAAGDEELCAFFREVQEDERALSSRAKALLRTRLSDESREYLELDVDRGAGAQPN